MWRLAVVLSGLVLSATLADDKPGSRGEVKLTEEGRRIHQEAIVVDGHNDLPYRYREKKDRGLDRFDIAKGVPDFHTDIPRLYRDWETYRGIQGNMPTCTHYSG